MLHLLTRFSRLWFVILTLFTCFSFEALAQKGKSQAPTPSVKKEILFEGYYKILADSKPIGYAIQRYEFDPQMKQFYAIQFTRIETQGSQTTESLRARADENFLPLSFEYTQLVDGKSTLIDAQFKQQKMTGQITKEGATQKISKDIPKGSFLSSFLVYLMMKSPTGLSSQTKFQYQAIAEEEGDVYKGEALVHQEEKWKDFRVLKVMNTFKGNKFVSLLTDRGEIVSTMAPDVKVGTEIVGKKEEALASFNFNEKVVRQLFGGIPEGKQNIVAKRAENSGPPAPGTKQDGIPPGQGFLIKPQGQGESK